MAPYDVVTDPRLSSADVGVYMRCRWLLDVNPPYGLLDWLVTELRMPDGETRDSVNRLTEFGHLEMISADTAESQTALRASKGVRDAIRVTIDALTPTERKAVAHFANLVDHRRDRAITQQGRSGKRGE
ncbi:hypothetical protein [Streptomyces sp. SID8350]|uniref:hypothetical protein n=1 Tax=Streptomyces sp. SID8350 TaxID=2690337 RepID=UPI00136AC344|nr:hypothetical protein [Streptomyces sp. SID8350]MYT97344.1 hypothetical protein [Streptomyces sp. SID8350]